MIYVYSYWNNQGHITTRAFAKSERAANFVFDQINVLSLGNKTKKKLLVNYNEEDKKETEEVSPELQKLKTHLKKERTFDNAVIAIKLFEEYNKYVLSTPSAKHTLQSVEVVE